MVAGLRYSARQLKRRVSGPVIILLIALSIGTCTAILQIADQLLLKSLPVRNPQNLFAFEKPQGTEVPPDHSFTYVEYEEVLKRRDLFSSAVAQQVLNASSRVRFGEPGDNSHLVTIQIVSPNFFSDLGISPIIGRVLDESAVTQPDIPAVLSYEFWKSEFESASGVVGRTIRIKNHVFRVAGVTGPTFHDIHLDEAPDIRLPISAFPVLFGYDINDGGVSGPSEFEIFARLSSGVLPQQAASSIVAQMTAATEWHWYEWNAKQAKPIPREVLSAGIKHLVDYRIDLMPAGRGVFPLRNYVGRTLKILSTAVIFLFLLVCATIVLLLSATFQERQKEIAVRLSLGATPRAIVWQIAWESLILIVPGVTMGIAVALTLSRSIMHLLSMTLPLRQRDIAQPLHLSLDYPTLGFFIGMLLLLLLSLGVTSGYLATGKDLASHLKGSSITTRQTTMQKLLAATEVAFAVVLLYLAGVSGRTFWNLEHVRLGFDPTDVVQIDLDPTNTGYSDSQFSSFARTLLQQINAIPGVRSAAYAASGLMRGIGMKQLVTPVGRSVAPGTIVNTSLNFVTSEYFQTLSIPLLAGQNLTDYRSEGALIPIVINKKFWDVFFPGQMPVGKYIVFGEDGSKRPNAVIIGVVGASKYRSLREDDPPTYFSSWKGSADRPLIVYVRTSGNSRSAVASIRQAANNLDKAIPVVRVVSLSGQIRESLWREHLMALLSFLFAITALLVAALGAYSILADSIKRRSRELGLRIALGAGKSSIAMTVCGPTALYAGAGLVLAGILITLTTGIVRHLVFGLSPFDTTSFLASLLIISIAVVSIGIHASRRAAKSDPAAILREE